MAVIVVFLDLDKAFETCSHEAIYEVLVSKGKQGNLLAYSNGLLQDRQAAVRF